MLTRIPVANLYYLLSYAWNRLEEDEAVDVAALEGGDAVNLLAQLLSAATGRALRRGLTRDYLLRTAELSGIRGRVRLAESARRLLLNHGRAVCDFDELERNSLPNRIIRTTLQNIHDAQALSPRCREQVTVVLREMREIEPIDLHSGLFRRVRLHCSNAHYGLMLSICELAYESMLPTKTAGAHRFRSFVEDHDLMARIYQDFVRNFYGAHSSECGYERVSAPVVRWAVKVSDERSRSLLPAMQTDVVLAGVARRIIVDCKFYHQALSRRFATEKLISGHLYQIYSYVKNQQTLAGWENCEGLLLYPTIEGDFEADYDMDGSRIRAATVDLAASWTGIRDRLLALVATDRTRAG